MKKQKWQFDGIWVPGDLFEGHLVSEDEPTIQVIKRADKLYILPTDYTLLDQLGDEEANSSYVPIPLSYRVNRVVDMLGIEAAKGSIVIDNTTRRYNLRQAPLDSGELVFPDLTLVTMLDVVPE